MSSVNDIPVFIAPKEGAFNIDNSYVRGTTKLDNASFDPAGDGEGFSSADMVAMMNNHEMLMGGSVKGSLLQHNANGASVARMRECSGRGAP